MSPTTKAESNRERGRDIALRCPPAAMVLFKMLQQATQTLNPLADVRLCRAAEAQAHFVVWFATGRIVGITQFARHVDHVPLQGGLEEFGFCADGDVRRSFGPNV